MKGQWTQHSRYLQLAPSPGMDRDLSVTLKPFTVLLLQEPVDEDTSRITCAAPPSRDSVEQGVHLSPKEDTAKLVASLAILTKNSSFITKVRTCLFEADDDNTIKPTLSNKHPMINLTQTGSIASN